MGLATASLCWMLQAYLPAEWALLGGLLAVVRISWFSYFGNSYWGGSVAILGGCLLLGAAARLARKSKPHDGLWMALGLLLLANSRPFEGALISLPICFYTVWVLFRKRARLGIWLPGTAACSLEPYAPDTTSIGLQDTSPFRGRPTGSNGAFAHPLCLANRIIPFITSLPINLFTIGIMRRCRTWQRKRRWAFWRKWS